MNTRNLLVSVLMLVSVLLAACAPAVTPPAPTVVPPTVAPTTAPTQEGLTTFSPKTFNLPITLSYGPEWRVDEEYSDLVTLGYKGHDAGVSFINVKNAKIADGIAFPDDFVTWIQSPDSLFQVVDSKSVLVGGIQGIWINATYTCGNKKIWIMLSRTGWGCANGEPIGFIYLDDVYGERVLIQIIPSDDKDYEFIVEEAQKVLDTVVFSKPTTFSPKTFDLPITLSYGSQWSVAEEYSDEFLLNYAGHDAGIAFINVKNAKYADGIAFPDDFVTWIQSPDSLFQVVDSKPVLVGGFKGIQINAIAACGDKKNWIMLSGTGWGCPGVEHIGFIYLDNVNGERVLIQIQGSPDGKDYMFIVEESQKVLDTVVFSKP